MKKQSKSLTPQPKQDSPEIVVIEMTPKLYGALKENLLKRVNPLARSYVNIYFEWLKSIKPEQIIDGIELGETPHEAYRKLGANPIRISIAMTRAFLRTHKKYAAQLREVANLESAITTLKYENPQAYTIIKKYGEKGTEFIKKWIQGALEILGALPKQQVAQKRKA